jgi:hypothetical protein
MDSRGTVLPGSERQIRIVGSPSLAPLSTGLSLLPLLAMVLVPALRARTYQRQSTTLSQPPST